MALWHFVYDGIISPTLRFHLKNDLFALRDETRRLLAKDDLNSLDKEIVVCINDSISLFINRLSYLRPSLVYRVNKEIERDRQLQEEVGGRLKSIQNTTNGQLHKVFKDMCTIITKATLYNSGALAIPLMLLIIPTIGVLITASTFNKIALELILTPKGKIKRFIPESV